MSDFDFGDRLRSSSDRLAAEGEQRRELAKRVIPWPLDYLQDVCHGIHPTDLIVVSAATGAGKTTLGSMLAERAAQKGRRVAFFALEAYENEIEQRILFRAICRRLSALGSYRRLTFSEWMMNCQREGELEESARRELDLDGLKTYYREERFGPDDIMRQFLAIRAEVDLIVLDHLHYVDHSESTDNAGIQVIARALRTVSLEIKTPVIAIAHLRKRDTRSDSLIPVVDDIHGSSEVSKVATKIVALASLRNTVFQSERSNISNTVIQVVKDRYAGVNGYAGVLKYNLDTQSYEDGYTLVRPTFGNKSLDLVNREDVPAWARHVCIDDQPRRQV